MILRWALLLVSLAVSLTASCLWERDNPRDQNGNAFEKRDIAGDLSRDLDATGDSLGDQDTLADGPRDLALDGGGGAVGGCDVDGDGHALPGTIDKACAAMPADDNDDYDSGKHPGTTKKLGGLEGGHVLGALRGWCSGVVLTKNSTSASPRYERDIDHDGDGKAASQDGCPAATCDADGDGFRNKACNPPLSKADCDDTNATVFPGAPDQCGDGIAQNCAADRACANITDKDGDKYGSKDDCDDLDASTHPWATEKCDGKDNDCDGLIDEGNPDHLGNLIPTLVKTCNDDNDGQCAPSCTPGALNCSPGGNLLSGICACSSRMPPGKRDAKDRVKCSGENLSKATTPRCFGATQPQPERCDTKDWDCNENNDDPAGKNFKDKGKPCSTNTGTCKAGTVIGCNLTTSVANATLVVAVMKKHGVEYNPNWFCTGATLFPIPEVCNGRDDDCDGFGTLQDVVGVDVGSKELDEKDADGDKYLACTACNGTGRTSLAQGLKGCGDCDEKSVRKASSYPGAPEKCNAWDDNCKDGTVDDGKDECPAKGTGWTCCSAQKSCRITTTDTLNCGACGKACDPRVADKCVGGKCVCGTTGGICKGGLNCVGGACKCVAGKDSMCAGCCAGVATCNSGTTVTYCGVGGVSCVACKSGTQCKSDACVAGKCTLVNKPSTTTCDDKLYCTTGDKCSAGTCKGGARDCSSQNDDCNTGTCSETLDMCYKKAKANLTSCSSSKGKCYSGKCCTGCWDAKAGTCRAGTSTSGCGKGGGNCAACPMPSNVCQVASCNSSGNCGFVFKGTQAVCTVGSKSGQCYNSSSPTCCTGCWDATTKSCRKGDSPTACGDGGYSCQKCSAPAHACKMAICTSAAVCGVAFRGTRALCSSGGKSGQCHNASSPTCCTGCWDLKTSTCKAGSSDSACGRIGGYCLTCSAPSNVCQVKKCSSSGNCAISFKGTGAACSINVLGGRCYNSSSPTCCTSCWDSKTSKCMPGDINTLCGREGNLCQNCTTSGKTCKITRTCQ